MEIGSFVRRERKRQGLTQNQLADLAGVGLNFVYQLEKNKQTVQMDTTNMVLNALGYRVSVARNFSPWDSPNDLKSDIRSGASKNEPIDLEGF